MEDGRRATPYEVIDTDQLIEQAFGLYDEYLAEGLEVPAEKVQTLQEKMVVLKRQNKRRFESLRTSVGNMAFQDQEKMGLGLMQMLFGNEDTIALGDSLAFSELTAMAPQEYILPNMTSLFEEANEGFVSGNIIPVDKETFLTGLRRHGAFLAARGGPEIRERVFIQQEMLGQLDLRDVEERFTATGTRDQLKAQIAENENAIVQFFGRLKTNGFDSAPEMVSRILSLVEENKELKALYDSGAPPVDHSEDSLETVQSRAYQKLSTDLGRQLNDSTLRKPVQKEVEVPIGGRPAKKTVRKIVYEPLDERDRKGFLKQMRKYEYEKQKPSASEQGGGND